MQGLVFPLFSPLCLASHAQFPPQLDEITATIPYLPFHVSFTLDVILPDVIWLQMRRVYCTAWAFLLYYLILYLCALFWFFVLQFRT